MPEERHEGTPPDKAQRHEGPDLTPAQISVLREIVAYRQREPHGPTGGYLRTQTGRSDIWRILRELREHRPPLITARGQTSDGRAAKWSLDATDAGRAVCKSWPGRRL